MFVVAAFLRQNTLVDHATARRTVADRRIVASMIQVVACNALVEPCPHRSIRLRVPT